MTSKLDSSLLELEALMGRTRRPNKFDLPTEGRIAMSQINEELGNDPSSQLSLRAAADEFGLPAGEVAMTDFYGLSLSTHAYTVGYHAFWGYGFNSVSDPDGDLQPRTVTPNTGGGPTRTVTRLTSTSNGGSVTINIDEAFGVDSTVEFEIDGEVAIFPFGPTHTSSITSAPNVGEQVVEAHGTTIPITLGLG
ncbi:conserved hypothetical protein [Vibrio chagasii]|nr:conserved hypothetical protein [Vibrio chagasii]CAH6906132.1 conserved hypothetical protein [Vibrio chagasii]CAH6968720.1 conserved hypothetical protein [Vibrio chagasii]CAH7386181.1 conserved hypothetical protein [Vibrio chagasii]